MPRAYEDLGLLLRIIPEHCSATSALISALVFQVMIKAFGSTGDLHMAFTLMDECSGRGELGVGVFAHLLVACHCDKDAGLKHAIEVRWPHRLLKRIFRPSATKSLRPYGVM